MSEEPRLPLDKIFVDLGRKNGLDEKLLNEVFNLLMKNQYIPKGNRNHVQSQLRRILK